MKTVNLLVILLLSIIILFSGCGKEDSKPNIVHQIEDNVDMFSPEQKAKINERMTLFSDQSVAIVTIDEIKSSRPFHYPVKRLKQFKKESDAENAILILICKSPCLIHVEFDDDLWVKDSYSKLYPNLREVVYPQLEHRDYLTAVEATIQYVKESTIMTRDEYLESNFILQVLSGMIGEYLSDSYSFIANLANKFLILPNFGLYYILLFQPFVNIVMFFFRLFGASIWAVIITLLLFLMSVSMLRVLKVKLPENYLIKDFSTAHKIAKGYSHAMGFLNVFYLFFQLLFLGFAVLGLFNLLMRFQTVDQIALSNWLYPGLAKIQDSIFSHFPIQGTLLMKNLSEPGGIIFGIIYLIPSFAMALAISTEMKRREAQKPQPEKEEDENIVSEVASEIGQDELDRETMMYGFMLVRTLLVGWFFPLALSICFIVEIWYRWGQEYVETLFLMMVNRLPILKPIIYRLWIVFFATLIVIFIVGFNFTWIILTIGISTVILKVHLLIKRSQKPLTPPGNPAEKGSPPGLRKK